MATANRNETRKSNRGRTSRGTNANGRNESSGVTGTARANPFTTAAAVGGAVAAGAFLWSRRDQISDQISNFTQRISQGRNDNADEDNTTNESFIASPNAAVRGGRRSQVEIAEEALTLKEIGISS